MKNKHSFFIEIAEKISEQSTCCRLKVGCILVNDGRIISIGYNGSPSNTEHCENHFSKEDMKDYSAFRKNHHEWSDMHELHAETNAILFAAKEGISTKNSILYVTDSPCIHCAKIIVSAGIKQVIYKNKYDNCTYGIDFLKNCGIKCDSLKELIK